MAAKPTSTSKKVQVNNVKKNNKKVVTNKKVTTKPKKELVSEKIEIVEEKKEVKHFESRPVNTSKKFPWGLIAFICPVIGIILYLLWKNEKHEVSSNILTGTIIGTVLWGFVACSFLISTSAEPKPVEKEYKVADWYSDVMNKESVVTVIGSSTCPHCQEYKPIITAMAEEYGFKMYFFESDKLSEEDNNILTQTYDLKNYEGYVPYTFIVSNNKFVADTTGYSEEETTIKFLKENKIITK